MNAVRGVFSSWDKHVMNLTKYLEGDMGTYFIFVFALI